MFVIVRHGNTFESGEAARRIGSATDLPLTARGEQQADALGCHFSDRGWQFSRILSSPLQRTMRTAERIAAYQASDVPIEIADFLREIDHGVDENQPEDTVLTRIGPEALALWDQHAVPPPGWIVDQKIRIAAWHALFASAIDAGGPVLLVTSNGAARFALKTGELADLPAQLKLPTGAYAVIDRLEPGGLKVRCWGVRP